MNPKESSHNRFTQTSRSPFQDGEVVEGEFIDTAFQPNESRRSNFSLAQNTHSALLQTRQLFMGVFRTDPESQRLAQAVLQEKLESNYLASLSKTDRQRAEALANQLASINQVLTDFSGKPTSILSMYRTLSKEDPQNYPDIGTYAGFFGIMRLHKELAEEILSAPEIASEAAEIKAQTEIIPLREKLNQLKIQERAKTAETFNGNANALKEAAENTGELRAATMRGLTIPIVTGVFELPVLAVKGPIDRFSRWIEESDDKGVPISAIIGGAGTAIIFTTSVAEGSTALGLWINSNVIFGGAIGFAAGAALGVAGWKIEQAGIEKVRDLKDWIADKIENRRRYR